MHILVASSSLHRQGLYREAIENLGHQVSVAGGGLDCVDRLRGGAADVLLLEAPLPWGGSDGVLEVVQQEMAADTLPVILVAVGTGSIDWFQLSRFRIDDFLFRVPTVQELGRAIGGVTARNAPLKRSNNAKGEACHAPRLPQQAALVAPSPSTPALSPSAAAAPPAAKSIPGKPVSSPWYWGFASGQSASTGR